MPSIWLAYELLRNVTFWAYSITEDEENSEKDEEANLGWPILILALY